MSDTAVGRTKVDCSAPIQERDVVNKLRDGLVADFGYHRSVRKEVARITGASPETVKKWLAAENAPSLVFFLRMLPHSPSLQAMVRKVGALERDLDPGFQRGLIDLMQRYIR